MHITNHDREAAALMMLIEKNIVIFAKSKDTLAKFWEELLAVFREELKRGLEADTLVGVGLLHLTNVFTGDNFKIS